MMKLQSQILRTFFHSVAFGAAATGLLASGSHRMWGAGFAIGAGTSLFSLFSLKVCVPALFQRGATQRSTALLHFALLAKLPLYAIALYFATRMGSGPAFAAFAGCGLVPFVITAETVCSALAQSSRTWKSALAMREPIAILPAVQELSRHVAELKAEAREPIAGAAQAAREGAL